MGASTLLPHVLVSGQHLVFMSLDRIEISIIAPALKWGWEKKEKFGNGDNMGEGERLKKGPLICKIEEQGVTASVRGGRR